MASFHRFSLIADSPGPFSGSGLTDSQGTIQFHMFVHDTDRFPFAAQADGFEPGEVRIGDGAKRGGVDPPSAALT